MPETCRLIRPRAYRLATIGGGAVASALLWAAACVLAYCVEVHEIPRAYMTLTGSGAIAATVSTVVVVTAYFGQRANVANQRTILIAVGTIAAQQEALGERFNKIDPAKIYADAVEDMLSAGNGRRP